MKNRSPIAVDMNAHPAFFRQLLFIGLECSRLYDFATEIASDWSTEMEAVGSNKEQLVLFLLRAEFVELILRDDVESKHPVWSKIPSEDWQRVVNEPTSWLPEAPSKTCFELVITEMGREQLKSFADLGLPPIS
jgi:hypothetical protein